MTVSVTAKSRTLSNGTANDATSPEASFVELYNNDSAVAAAINAILATDSTTSTVDGKFIRVRNSFTGAPASGEHAGLEIERGTSANVQVRFNETNDVWEITVDGTNYVPLMAGDSGELTIATGAITVVGAYHTIDTEADAASDDLDTINGGKAGYPLIVQAENPARTVVLKHNTGNIFNPSGADITLDDDTDIAFLVYSTALSKWVVISPNDITAASDTAAGKIEIAIQSEMEAGTDTTRAVTPGRQHFHPSACKAWASMNGTGTAALNSSYNMTSITDNGTGDYTFTIATDFGDALYCGVASAADQSVAGTSAVCASLGNVKAAGSSRCKVFENGGSYVDVEELSVAFFGDHA